MGFSNKGLFSQWPVIERDIALPGKTSQEARCGG
jgi:hypothetical protein